MNVMQTGGALIGKHCDDIVIASDLSGRGLMLEIEDYLNENDVAFRRIGVFEDGIEVGVASLGAMGNAARCILIVDDADSVCMAVNSIAGARCVNADKPARVILARKENDANMIALDYMATGFGVNMESVWKFITTDFAGDEFERRLREWEGR